MAVNDWIGFALGGFVAGSALVIAGYTLWLARRRSDLLLRYEVVIVT